MNKALFDSRAEKAAEFGKDVLRIGLGGVGYGAGGLQKLWSMVDASNVTNAVSHAVDSKMDVVSEFCATGTQATSQVLNRVGRVMGDDVKKMGSGVSKFIDNQKGLSLAAQGMKGGLSEAGHVVSLVKNSKAVENLKKGASKVAKGIGQKISRSRDWEEEGEYEPPKIVGLPEKDLYYLSVDEKQQQEGLVSRFFVKLGLQQKDLSRQLARLLRSKGGKDGGDGYSLKELIAQETNLNRVREDYGGFTLLQLAIIVDDLEMAKELLQKGASSNQPDHHGHSPLHLAIIVEGSNLRHMVDLLFSFGADSTAKDKEKRTVLHWCAQTSHTDVFAEFVRRGSVLNSLDSRSHTELFHAVVHHQPEMVKCMLEKGCSPAAVDPWGRTPLHFAASLGSTKICEILLESQPTLIEAEDGFFWTPVFYATSEGRLDVLKLLVEKYNVDPHREFPVTTWRSSGAFWLKKFILPAGDVLVSGALLLTKMMRSQEDRKNQSTVFQEERFAMSLLHRAAMKGHPKVCEYLIDVSKIPVDKPQIILARTPLHLACAEGQPEVVKVLLKKGANGEAKDKYDFRPLHLACIGDHYLYVELKPKSITEEHIACARLLLEAGVQRNPRVTTRPTPLPFALMSEVALYGTQGCTPLHFATMRGDVQLVKTLLKHGCDPEILSHMAPQTLFAGMTPIMMTTFRQGVIIYYDERILTFGAGIIRSATVWEISLNAQYSLQLLWKKWFNKYPRMEGVVEEKGAIKFDPKNNNTLELKLSAYTKRVFVLGIGSLKIDNYTLGDHRFDQPIAKLSFSDPTVKINALEDYDGSSNCIRMSSVVKGSEFSFVMSLKSKTEKMEWLAALRVRFWNRTQQKKNIKNEKFFQFKQAAARGSYEKVREFLKGGMNVNSTDKQGRTALHIAAANGHFQVVEELLSFGADVNKVAKGGQTPLHSVAFWGCTLRFDLPWWMAGAQTHYGRYDSKEVNNLNPRSAIAYLLLQWGADPKARNEEGFIPFDLGKDFPMRWVTFHGKMYSSGWIYYYVREGALKGWNRYWAVLTSDTIFLHNTAPTMTNVQGVERTIEKAWTNPANSVKLEGGKVQLHLRNPLRRNAFEVITKEGNTKVFSISDDVSKLDEESLHTWVEKIQRRIRILNDPKSAHQIVNQISTVNQLNEIHDAARAGDVKKLRDLIKEQGRDPNYIRASDGRSPLHIASKHNQVQAVEELLSFKADPLLEDKHGWTAIHIAAFMGYVEVLSHLLPFVPSGRLWADITPLHRAAETNKAQVLEYLLKDFQKMFDINAHESLYLDSPLHLAARLGNEEAVELLLKFGAKTNIKNRASKTPAQVASTETIKKALETGFNYIRSDDLVRLQELVNKDKSAFTKVDFQGFTMIHVAAQEGTARIVDFILKTKPETIQAETTDGSLPLHIASKFGNIGAVKLLLAAGAQVNSTNHLKDTPLHFAAMRGHKEVATLLLEKGADPKAPNSNLQTPETLDAYNILNTRSLEGSVGERSLSRTNSSPLLGSRRVGSLIGSGSGIRSPLATSMKQEEAEQPESDLYVSSEVYQVSRSASYVPPSFTSPEKPLSARGAETGGRTSGPTFAPKQLPPSRAVLSKTTPSQPRNLSVSTPNSNDGYKTATSAPPPSRPMPSKVPSSIQKGRPLPAPTNAKTRPLPSTGKVRPLPPGGVYEPSSKATPARYVPGVDDVYEPTSKPPPARYVPVGDDVYEPTSKPPPARYVPGGDDVYEPSSKPPPARYVPGGDDVYEPTSKPPPARYVPGGDDVYEPSSKPPPARYVPGGDVYEPSSKPPPARYVPGGDDVYEPSSKPPPARYVPGGDDVYEPTSKPPPARYVPGGDDVYEPSSKPPPARYVPGGDDVYEPTSKPPPARYVPGGDDVYEPSSKPPPARYVPGVGVHEPPSKLPPVRRIPGIGSEIRSQVPTSPTSERGTGPTSPAGEKQQWGKGSTPSPPMGIVAKRNLGEQTTFQRSTSLSSLTGKQGLLGRARNNSSPDAMKIVTVHIHESKEKATLPWEASKTLAQVIEKTCLKRGLSSKDYCLVLVKEPNVALDSAKTLGDLSSSEFAMVLKTSLKAIVSEAAPLKLAVWKSGHNIVEVLLVDSEERQKIPYDPNIRVVDIREKICKRRGLNPQDYRITLADSLSSLNEEMALCEIPNFQQKLEMHCENNVKKAAARELRKSVNEKKLQVLKGEKVLTRTDSNSNLESTLGSLGSEVKVPKGFKHKYPKEFPTDSPAQLLNKVKGALAQYNIFDDERASLENSSVNAAFGMIAGGALAPSVAVFPLMFPEAQGWLSYSLGVKLARWNVWVSIGKAENSKTGDYLIGYKTIPTPPSMTAEKKKSKPSVMFYISVKDIQSVSQKKSTSTSFVITLKDKTKISLKAATPSEAQAWARLTLGSVLAKRDWNEEFQVLVDKGLGLPEEHTTKDQEQAINDTFGELVREFTALAGVLTSIIVAERWLPSDKTRLVSPMSDSGAGGQKFLTHNIFIKFAIMLEECSYYHSEEEQAKASELELKSLNAYMRHAMRISSKARFPLMSMFDYRGLRLTATPCLPLKEIVYGSADRAKSIHASVPQFNETMGTLGSRFKIKPHFVFSNEAKRVFQELLQDPEFNKTIPQDIINMYSKPPFGAELVGCGDVEGHLGKDQRFYLLDTARLFPPTAWLWERNGLYFPYIRGGFLCRMLRPEFLQGLSCPLSSDALSRWGVNPLNEKEEADNNSAVVDATRILETNVIPAAAAALEYSFSPFLTSENTVNQEGAQILREIIVDIHGRGINVRYLGLLRTYLSNSSSASSLLSTLIFTEMMTRVAKSWMNSQMRGLHTSDFIAHQQLICDLFNQVFLSTDSPFWVDYAVSQLQHKFGPAAAERDATSLLEQILWPVMFERIQQMTQILWKEDARSKVYLGNSFLSETDILSVSPRAKHLFVVAKQNASFAQLKNRLEEGANRIKIKLGTTVLSVRPQWRHVLNKWLEAVERYPSDGEAVCSWVESHTQHIVFLRHESQIELAKEAAGQGKEEAKLREEFGILQTYATSARDASSSASNATYRSNFGVGVSPREIFTREVARYQVALRVEPSNPTIYCRYANFLYSHLEDIEGAELQLSKAQSLSPNDARVKLHVSTFEQFKQRWANNPASAASTSSSSASSSSTSIVVNYEDTVKEVRKRNIGALNLVELSSSGTDDETRTWIDPTLKRHRQLIDDLCFDLVTRSLPFRVSSNESIGKTRDAKVILHNILNSAKQTKSPNQDSLVDSVLLDIPFARNHAVDFAAPPERGKRDWVGCFPIPTGKETEEEQSRMSLMACDVHENIFQEKKKLFFFDHVTIARRDEWQQVEHEGFSEGSLCFPKKKGGIKELVMQHTAGEEDNNKLSEGIYEYRYYRMKGDLFLLLEFAQNLMEVDDFGAANLFYKQALDLAPKHEEVTCSYARFLFRLSEKMKLITGNKLYKRGAKIYLNKADKVLKRGLKSNPDHVPSLLTRSEILLQIDVPASAKYAEKVLRDNPYNVNALLLFAESAVAAKRLPIADKYFRNALALSSNDMDILMGYGILNIRAGDYEKAEGLYSRALLLYPNNPVLLASYFDNVLSMTQVVSHSQHVLEKLLQFDPTNAENWIRKGKFLWQYQGDLESAEKMFKKACEFDMTPRALSQSVIFKREVEDDLIEANKLQRTVIFNLDYRKQERWEFFIRYDNEAFTQQKKHFAKKILNLAAKTGLKVLVSSVKEGGMFE